MTRMTWMTQITQMRNLNSLIIRRLGAEGRWKETVNEYDIGIGRMRLSDYMFINKLLQLIKLQGQVHKSRYPLLMFRVWSRMHSG